MKSDHPFTKIPEFEQFKEVMRGILAVPKERLDELVQQAKKESPRINDSHSPGRKAIKRGRA